MIRALARLLLAAVFLDTSMGAIRNAEQMTGPAEKLDLPEPERLVRMHGVANLVGGVLLATGIRPRLASWGLIVNLIMATLGGHRFWEEDDEQAKMGQRIQFMKNVSLLGGLFAVIAAEGQRKAS